MVIRVPEGLKEYMASLFSPARATSFHAKTNGGLTEIDLYDAIGFFGVSAKDLRGELRNAGDVRLRIHSPGGDVFDALAMYQDLKDHKGNVTVEIPGMAASAASIVAMAGDQIRIASNAFMMVHRAWGFVVGNRTDMAEVIEILDKIDNSMAETYAARTGRRKDTMMRMMEEESWMNGKQAIKERFADELIEDPPEPEARFNLSIYDNAPTEWATNGKTKPESFRDYERFLMQDAGLSRSCARALLRGGLAGMQDAASQGTIAMQDAGEWADNVERLVTMLKG